jgi:hypothetical protein
VLGHLVRCTAVLYILAATGVHAQDKPEAKSGPPVTIGGFRYEHLPPRIHMNICEAEACTPGSKVSYVFYAPNPEPSFDQYLAERARIADALKRSAAPGTTLTFDPPEQTKDPLFTFFKARRVDTFPNGSKQYVLSERFYSPHMTVEIISSSPDEKAAKSNRDLFTLALMLVAQANPISRQ